jgi:hypothetical protein
MRYLAILLLLPWLLILCWGYWSYPKSLPRSAPRRAFDLLALLLSLAAAVTCALHGFDAVQMPAIDQFGRASGGIWQQVFPALYGYGAFAAVLLLALIVRQLCWRRR